MSPKPRRAERRAGRRSERLREALSWPDTSHRSVRAPADKRAAFARFRGRSAPVVRSRWVSAALLVGLVAAGALALRAFADADDLVAFEDAPAQYDALAAEAARACRAGRCAWGWASHERPPPALRARMARLRVRQLDHDSALGRTVLEGGYGAAFRLTHDAPSATPDQTRFRAAADRLERRHWARQAPWRTPPTVHELGGGWSRVRTSR